MDIVLNENQEKIFSALFEQVDGVFRLKQNYHREIAFFGGFRSGKSYIMALVIYLIAITYKVHIVVLRQTYGELRDSSIVQFRNDFERFGKFEYKVAARDAVFGNGSIISFRAYSDDESKIKSSNFDVGLLVQAEELPHPVFLQVLGRLSGNGIPKPLLLTEGNPSDSWCKERYVERTSKEIADDGILFIQGTTYDNQTNIPKTYIQDLLTQYPQDYIDRYVF